jgi:hypothetical protein
MASTFVILNPLFYFNKFLPIKKKEYNNTLKRTSIIKSQKNTAANKPQIPP